MLKKACTLLLRPAGQPASHLARLNVFKPASWVHSMLQSSLAVLLGGPKQALISLHCSAARIRVFAFPKKTSDIKVWGGTCLNTCSLFSAHTGCGPGLINLQSKCLVLTCWALEWLTYGRARFRVFGLLVGFALISMPPVHTTLRVWARM